MNGTQPNPARKPEPSDDQVARMAKILATVHWRAALSALSAWGVKPGPALDAMVKGAVEVEWENWKSQARYALSAVL